MSRLQQLHNKPSRNTSRYLPSTWDACLDECSPADLREPYSPVPSCLALLFAVGLIVFLAITLSAAFLIAVGLWP
jgi:hypothetical protein